MKKQKLQKTIGFAFAIFLVSLLSSKTVFAKQTCGDSDDDGDGALCCTVSEQDADFESMGSLSSAVEAYNLSGSARRCTTRIVFDVDQVNVTTPMIFSSQSSSSPFVIGNSSGSATKIVASSDLGSSDAIFTADGVSDFTLQNVEVDAASESAAPLFRCTGGAKVITLDHVTINNLPSTALKFEDCDGVKLTNVTINGTATGGQAIDIINASATTAADGTTVDGVEISSAVFMKDLGAAGIQIKDSNDVHLSDVTIDDVAGTAVSIDGGTLSSIESLTVTNARATGLSLSNISNANDQTDISGLSLTGKNNVSGDGLYINNATQIPFDFSSGDTISGFGNRGIFIEGASSNLTISNATILENGSYGIELNGTSFSNSITGSTITDNGGCGIALTSSKPNQVKSNNLTRNGGSTPCAIGGSDYVASISSGVYFIPISDTRMLFTVSRTSMGLTNAQYFEIHHTPEGSVTSAQTAGPSTADDSSSMRTKRVSSSRFAGSLVDSVGAGINLVSGRGTDSFKRTLGSGSSGSSTGSSDSWSDNTLLPGGYLSYDDLSAYVSGTNEDNFTVIVYDSSSNVIGLWAGGTSTTAYTDETGSMKYCYQDPANPQAYFRTYDANVDSDEDGLSDSYEDWNLNCVVDSDIGETDPDKADTDSDGLSDYAEVVMWGYATDPNNQDTDGDSIPDGLEDKNGDRVVDSTSETDPTKLDTDGDGVNDGVEDANHNGEVDAGETNPRSGYKDTDGDGQLDGVDACPLLGDSQECYYSNCAVGAIPATPTDEDQDGIYDYLEDTNLNCQNDPGIDLSNAGLGDTDGDGLLDGQEDRNHNGIYEPDLGETDPNNPDSDGDLISDGDEDKNADGVIDLSAGETNPCAGDVDGDGVVDGLDSDGDGLADGDEDLNHDGSVNTGETNGSMADTDGDGLNDKEDLAPWSITVGADVYYAGQNLDRDSDGDGKMDKDETAGADKYTAGVKGTSDPLDADTDDDGLNDYQEGCFGTNPQVVDTDGDGESDFDEIGASVSTCGAINYALGSSDPLKFNNGSCSLNTGAFDATSASLLPIISMMSVAGWGWLRSRRSGAKV